MHIFPLKMCSSIQPIPETAGFKVIGVRLGGIEKDEYWALPSVVVHISPPKYEFYHGNNEGGLVGWEGKG